MEFLDFWEEKNRLCERNTCSVKCPFYRGEYAVSCDDFIRFHPEKAERIVEQWVKEHSVVTNRNKFVEIFGTETKGFSATPEWWKKEYKKPEDIKNEES